jgi:outer membrane protein TolC
LLVAESQQKQALLGYQRSIITAFQEVNDSLIDQVKTREQLAAQARQVHRCAITRVLRGCAMKTVLPVTLK